jgi:hypothetical protein
MAYIIECNGATTGTDCGSRGPRVALWLSPSLLQLAVLSMGCNMMHAGAMAGPAGAESGIPACPSVLLQALLLMSATVAPRAHPKLQGWVLNTGSLSPAQLVVCGAHIEAVLQQQVRLAADLLSAVSMRCRPCTCCTAGRCSGG